MNAWGHLYLTLIGLNGSGVPGYYREYLRADEAVAPETACIRLAAQLRHCRDHVPYYREILQDLPDPETDPIATLSGMPILSKKLVRERFEDLRANDVTYRHVYVNTSGGSTGEPIRFLQDRDYNHRNVAMAMAFSRWVGHEVGNREARLWGSERDVITGTLGWRKRVANTVRRTTFLNAFKMTRESMLQWARTLEKQRPDLVVAYAQALYEFAGFLEAAGATVPRLEAIISSGGTLHGFMRERIERVFSCPVYDRYGCREVGLIAAERRGIEGLWVPPWNVFVEVVDSRFRPVPDGTEGEILVTSLVNRAMPLVRYRIGDRGVMRPGFVHGSRALERVSGRNVDAFRLRDGGFVDGAFFINLMFHRPWVEKFQFRQTDYDHVVLTVVAPSPDHAPPAQELADLEGNVKAALGTEATMEVRWVRSIPAPASNKYRYTICEIEST